MGDEKECRVLVAPLAGGGGQHPVGYGKIGSHERADTVRLIGTLRVT